MKLRELCLIFCTAFIVIVFSYHRHASSVLRCSHRARVNQLCTVDMTCKQDISVPTYLSGWAEEGENPNILKNIYIWVPPAEICLKKYSK